MFRNALTHSALAAIGSGSCALLLCIAVPALAGSAKPALAGGALPAPKDDFTIPDAIDARADVSNDNLFGFTDGTDTNSAGEREFSFDTITSVGKRAVTLADGTPGGKGRFYATSQQASVQYGVTDAFNIELGAFGELRHVRGVPDIADKSNYTFNGLSAQFKYRLIERTPDNPIGVALSVEPRWARVADQEGVAQKTFSAETKLMLDARLIPGLLWYGVNIGLEPQAARFHTGQGERQSTFMASNALSMRVLNKSAFGIGTYFGFEASYQRAYTGLFAQQISGEAAFAGLTLFHQFSKNVHLAAAWSTQVWGRQRDPAPLVSHSLDLWNFQRHIARLKVSFNF